MSKKHKKILRRDKIGPIPILERVPEARVKPASTITKCPRCNSDVQILEHRISQCICGMSLDESNGRFYFTISPDKKLVWRVDEHDVVMWRLYVVINENGLPDLIDEPMKLPWLPFDITEERLKLFLVFS